ncbi:ABC transporter ATP-binding protein [Phytoactinopolyspora limicola]|uniref:ABC transporter ATP-binding protein n=1 Tax=Phytoactinopolyspora limicola TaxID=2715536 RepID=UPI00140E8551|nr:ABC transporter ATP-binding protein [Phytoactinopolyspora limicola]
MTTDLLAALELRVSYGSRTVLDGLAAGVQPGEALALVGANGSGKSTLLRALARLLPADAGTVLLDGADIARLPTAEVARRLAVLPQGPVPPSGVTVRELVEHGRFPHRSALARPTAADRDAVRDALAMTGLTDYADRYVDRLSGGERQRAWIALTIAQETPILLLDEPTTFLDMGHQLEVLDLVARLRQERRLTVIVVLHDLNQAARYCDRIVALSGGQVVADGPPAQVVTEEFLVEYFGVRATVSTDPVTGAVVCLPYAAVPPSP